MPDWKQVTTQAEFQAALDAGAAYIELTKAITVDIHVPEKIVAAIKLVAGAWARVFSGKVEAWGSSHVVAWESSHVEAWGSSHVEARGSSHVVAWESSHVEAWGNSHVEARGSSHVVAWGSSHVEAWGSSHVEAWGSSHVEAWESSHVEAWGSSHVVAWGNSHVEARGAVSLRLFHKTITASAAAQVAVQLHGGAKCKGGAQTKIVQPATAREWCDFYGAEVQGKNAILFKGLNAEFHSDHGEVYVPGTETIAPDWDGGEQECGKGLHFSPCPSMTREFATNAAKFVACLVPLAGLAVHPDGSYPQKVKAEKCWNYYECDSMGNVIGNKHQPPKAKVVRAKKAKK